MVKKTRVIGFIVLLMFLFTGTAVAYDSNHRDIWVTDNGETTKYSTPLFTIEELFTKEGIVIEDKDMMNVDINGNLKHGLRIEIKRGLNVSFQINGEVIAERAQPGIFVGTLINQRSREDGADYVYGGNINEEVYEGMRIHLQEKTTETIVLTESLPYESTTVETEALIAGITEVAVEGRNGEKEITMLVTYIDGVEVSREFVEEAIIMEPVNEEIHVGIGRTLGMQTDVENLNYLEKFTMEATAYTTGHDGVGTRTASGRTVEYGLVSVDPRVIPLGTELYIENYGYAIAADTGGAIKGKKIDLYFNSPKECIRFGRRQVKVYVLG